MTNSYIGKVPLVFMDQGYELTAFLIFSCAALIWEYA